MKNSLLALMLTGSIALAKTTTTQTTVIECSSGAKCSGSNSNTNPSVGLTYAPTAKVGGKRDLSSLFRRSDPEFHFAMSILERNAEAAQRTIPEIVANIHKGTVSPDIEAAALQAGIITKKVSKRSGTIKEHFSSQGGKQDSSQVAQHIISGGNIPPEIKAALQASPHYLLPGQSAKNPTAPPKASSGAKKGPRDLSMNEVYERDLESMYERDLADQLLERDIYESSLYERDILDERDLITRALFERDPEAEVTYAQITALAGAVQSNPKAGHAVYQALTMDPDVENVTEKLVADWVTSQNHKRDAEAYEGAYLEVRDAEAYEDAYLEARDAEAYENAYLEARDAYADPEPEEYYYGFEGFESF